MLRKVEQTLYWQIALKKQFTQKLQFATNFVHKIDFVMTLPALSKHKLFVNCLRIPFFSNFDT